jgi:branched-chain amino acid transport system substrate-binding protein
MIQTREFLQLMTSLVVTGGLVAAGTVWILADRPAAHPVSAKTSSAHISTGQRQLIATEGQNQPEFITAKTAGIQALATGDRTVAAGYLGEALRLNRNAPETRIYSNNAQIGDGEAYSIAVVGPIGTNLDGSLEILRGVAQAQTEINAAGGIAGRKLRVMIADDGGKVENAIPIAQAFVNDASVLGVVGHYASEITLAAGNVYDAGKLVVISPISSSVKLTNFSPYVFRTLPSDYIAGRALASYAIDTLKKRQAVLFFNSESTYSQSLKHEFATAITLGGGAIVAEFDLANPDFNAEQALSEAATADVIMLAANTKRVDQAIQVIQANQSIRPILGGDDLYTPKTLKLGGKQSIGMVVAVPWHSKGRGDPRFSKSAREFWGGDVNWRTALAYDATQVLAAAIQLQPDRLGMPAVLVRSDFAVDGASGQIRFLPSGDRNMGIQLVEVVAGGKAHLGLDFVPINSQP